MNLLDAILKLIGWRAIVDPAVTMKPIEHLWNTATVKAEWKSTLDWYVAQALKGRERYELVASKTGVPWQVVAVIHGLEAGFSWSKHLHNGDPLTARTVQVPKGRPLPPAMPPFTWIQSATDALIYDNLDDVEWEDLAESLEAIEAYNGLGYRKRGVNSPYLWSGTRHYTKGKYVKDGMYSVDAVSKQLGAVPLLKALGWTAK